jgi:hypothetical protein
MSAEADAAEFAFLAADFSLRKPAKYPLGLTRGVGRGVCLEPLLSGTSHVWFDPALEPRDGDLVLVEYSDEWANRVLAAVEKESFEYREAWQASDCVDGVMPRLAAKLFRIRDGVPWLLCNAYAVRLERVGRVVGVARRIELDGVPLYGSYDAQTRGRSMFLHVVVAAIALLIAIVKPWRFL